jgi:hypothetical protein
LVEKFRGLVYRVKYGAVIGRGTRIFACAQYKFPGYLHGFFEANHRAVFDLEHQTRNLQNEGQLFMKKRFWRPTKTKKRNHLSY